MALHSTIVSNAMKDTGKYVIKDLESYEEFRFPSTFLKQVLEKIGQSSTRGEAITQTKECLNVGLSPQQGRAQQDFCDYLIRFFYGDQATMSQMEKRYYIETAYGHYGQTINLVSSNEAKLIDIIKNHHPAPQDLKDKVLNVMKRDILKLSDDENSSTSQDSFDDSLTEDYDAAETIQNDDVIEEQNAQTENDVVGEQKNKIAKVGQKGREDCCNCSLC